MHGYVPNPLPLIDSYLCYWSYLKFLKNCLIIFFRLLVGYTEDKDDMFGPWKEWKGYAYAGAMFGVAAIQSLALHQYFHIMQQIGMRMRTGIIGLVYEKVTEILVSWKI